MTLFGVMLQEGVVPRRDLELIYCMCAFYGIPHTLITCEGMIVLPKEKTLACDFARQRECEARAEQQVRP